VQAERGADDCLETRFAAFAQGLHVREERFDLRTVHRQLAAHGDALAADHQLVVVMRDFAQVAQFQALQSVTIHEHQLERVATQRRGVRHQHKARVASEGAAQPLKLRFTHVNLGWNDGS
jgi:hypothetical protein